jgi:DNA-binding transcriptional ArsR family regulator
VTQAVPVTRQAATKHLELLQAAGLVTSCRRGRERVWTLQTQPLINASDYLNQLSRRWDAAIDRLRAYVED